MLCPVERNHAFGVVVSATQFASNDVFPDPAGASSSSIHLTSR
jgi:hypothetical protein